jgi:hypothetical protein
LESDLLNDISFKILGTDISNGGSFDNDSSIRGIDLSLLVFEILQHNILQHAIRSPRITMERVQSARNVHEVKKLGISGRGNGSTIEALLLVPLFMYHDIFPNSSDMPPYVIPSISNDTNPCCLVAKIISSLFADLL